MSAHVVVDPSTLRRGPLYRGGFPPITGGIWLVLDGARFPAEGYDDFVIAVLAWFTDAVGRLLQDPVEPELVEFMDDPYAVELRVESTQLLCLRALEGGDYTERLSVTAELPAFAHSLLSAADAVLAECARLGWMDENTVRLGAGIADLRRGLGRPD